MQVQNVAFTVMKKLISRLRYEVYCCYCDSGGMQATTEDDLTNME